MLELLQVIFSCPRIENLYLSFLVFSFSRFVKRNMKLRSETTCENYLGMTLSYETFIKL
jgi:hypothetical protein